MFPIKYLEKYAAANGAFYVQQFFYCELTGTFVDIHNDVTDFFTGLQVLAANVDVVVRENLVNGAEYTGYIVVNMQNAVFARMRRQGHFWEVN